MCPSILKRPSSNGLYQEFVAVLEFFDMSFPFLSSRSVWLFVACDSKTIRFIETGGFSGCGSANELSISLGC